MAWDKQEKPTTSFSKTEKPTTSFTKEEKPFDTDNFVFSDGNNFVFSSNNFTFNIEYEGGWSIVEKS